MIFHVFLTPKTPVGLSPYPWFCWQARCFHGVGHVCEGSVFGCFFYSMFNHLLTYTLRFLRKNCLWNSFSFWIDFSIDFGSLFGPPWSSKIKEKQGQSEKLKLQRRLGESLILTSRATANPFKTHTHFLGNFVPFFRCLFGFLLNTKRLPKRT